ncbi:MAG: toxin, partial [Acidobacteria bacterium]
MINQPATKSGGKKTPFEGSSFSAPILSLPKGGGAIRGIGEKFSVNAANGSVSFTIPIFTTPSRSDFSPKLSLQYDSGSGNGPFGLGWSLSVPSITRKTEKGLPRYWDSEDSDVFILSDSEDLVPSMSPEGDKWTRDEADRNLDQRAYTVRRYRPRIETLFARIERWKDRETGEVHWRSISRENIISIYGRTPAGRVSDRNDSLRVFKWLLEESHDDKGNQIVYEYKQEDQENVNRSSPHEVNRLDNRASNANCYLKRIKYGNKAPGAKDDCLFEVVFDYGEHDRKQPWLNEFSKWPCRLDCLSSFRAGFDIRTRRLCRRILIFHNFADELGSDHCLVRSTDFDYDENPVASSLASVTQTGYVMDKQSGVYRSRSFPKLEFAYSPSTITPEIHFFDSESLQNLPVGSDGTLYRWLDLDSEGISGILTEQANAWFYKRNLGNGRFGPEERLPTHPSMSDLNSGRQEILDLQGNGRKCLVQFSQPVAGYHERDVKDQWGPFNAFTLNPNVSWNDPNLKLIDLDGDGFSDLLISDEEVFRWFPSRTKEGFGAAVTVPKAADEERGPQLVVADSTHSIHLADMSGDGLTDIVRIRNGEICYWPNMGYGRFGPKVTMAAPPSFDNPDQFDPKRIRLADADGSGTTDIIYLGRDSVMLWLNQAGNSWSDPQTISNFPLTDNLSSVTAVDLFGNGTACLVWSTPLPRAVEQPMRYIDLMGGHKPHLLTSITNNMGSEIRLRYTASTKFYLEDLAAGNPWITKLPFPVQVLERVETRDTVNDTQLVSSYKYHHGYYDGVEREFRGFGLVESWDAESFEDLAGAGSFHVAPIHTKTWFHTGACAGREDLSRYFAQEY